MHKYRPARTVQSTAPTGGGEAAQGSFSIQSTHMESRVTAVEGNIKSLTSAVEGLRQHLGTVQHSAGRLETGQACGNSLMIGMLEGMGWSQEQIQQRLVQVGMSHSSPVPNLQGLPASKAPKTKGVHAPLSASMDMDPANREDKGEKAKHLDCHKGPMAKGPAQHAPQGGRLPNMLLDHAEGLLRPYQQKSETVLCGAPGKTQNAEPRAPDTGQTGYGSSLDPTRGDSPQSRATSLHEGTDDSDDDSAERGSPLANREIKEHSKRSLQTMHLAYPDDFWKKPITRKLQGRAIDSLAREELVELLKSVDPKILPASTIAPLIAHISHRLVAGCLVVVQQGVSPTPPGGDPREMWIPMCARVSALNESGEPLWECDMPPLLHPPPIKGDFSMTKRGACQLQKAHVFLRQDDAQDRADELNPPYKRRCRHRGATVPDHTRTVTPLKSRAPAPPLAPAMALSGAPEEAPRHPPVKHSVQQ